MFLSFCFHYRLYKLKKKLAKLHPEGEQYEPQSHYEGTQCELIHLVAFSQTNQQILLYIFQIFLMVFFVIIYLRSRFFTFCIAIYSGDYKWFESESEEEIESESPTGTPTHDRTPCPSEAEGDQSETKETGDKGIT